MTLKFGRNALLCYMSLGRSWNALAMKVFSVVVHIATEKAGQGRCYSLERNQIGVRSRAESKLACVTRAGIVSKRKCLLRGVYLVQFCISSVFF